MTPQEKLELGKQAEAFLTYTQENLYFKELLERIKLSYAQAILSFNPTQKDDFSYLRAKMEAIDDIANSISGDIYLGGEALKELDGKKDDFMGIL
jgi:hypothetical protein